MAQSDYEILPHKLLEDLKYDVEALKKKLSHPDAKMQELLLEIEMLKDSIHDLNDIFRRALETTKGDDPSGSMKVVTEKLSAVVSQNETIAKGMIAISDKLEDWMNKTAGLPAAQPSVPTSSPASMMPRMPPSAQHSMGPPPQGRAAPPPGGIDMDMPPPPPGKKRKGLF